jgi:TolB protein
MRTTALLAVLAAVALGSLATDAAQSSPPASVGSIVYSGSSDGDGNHLFVVGSNGAGRRRLTSGSTFDVGPTWSPGRRRIAFVSIQPDPTVTQPQQDIFMVSSDGTGRRRVLESSRVEEGPSWSPDGRSIVFTRDGGVRGSFDLYVVTVATGKVRRLTATSALEGAPSWSPDGKWIAYVRDAQIWLVRPDGKAAHGLGKTGAGTDWGPDWSPDSRRIAYESTTRTSLSNPVSEIWVMCRDGTGKRRLTPYRPGRSGATSPAWSPGGAQIAFSRGDQLWTMRPDGSHVRQLTRRPGEAYTPDW